MASHVLTVTAIHNRRLCYPSLDILFPVLLSVSNLSSESSKNFTETHQGYKACVSILSFLLPSYVNNVVTQRQRD